MRRRGWAKRAGRREVAGCSDDGFGVDSRLARLSIRVESFGCHAEAQDRLRPFVEVEAPIDTARRREPGYRTGRNAGDNVEPDAAVHDEFVDDAHLKGAFCAAPLRTIASQPAMTRASCECAILSQIRWLPTVREGLKAKESGAVLTTFYP